MNETAEFASTVKPPAADAVPGVIAQLVERHGASWVDAAGLADWQAGPGDRVLLLAGDPVRFPEGLDVAVVLPEILRGMPGRFTMGVARRADEAAIAARFGSQRWPSLVFLRDGAYVTTLPGMHDWADFVAKVQAALALPASRVPGIGIPLVAADGGPSCH